MGKKQIVQPVGAALFGETRQAVLRLMLGHPDERFYLTQILRQLQLGSGTVQRELARLTQVGILKRTVEGRQTYYQADQGSPIFLELQNLTRKTFGVSEVVRTALSPLAKRIHFAFIFGSVAKGAENRSSDIDLMVIGDTISFGEITRTLRKAQETLQREINPSVYGMEEFLRKYRTKHHFISSVIAGPKIFLIGSKDEFKGLA